jgi:hypothetical protein
VINLEDRTLINTYVPIKIVRKRGDVTPWHRQLQMMFPDPRDLEIMRSYLAALVQYPGVKFQWCPLIQGAEGNGKSFISRALTYAIGSRYVHLPSAAELGDGGFKFNGWLLDMLLIIIEEIFVSNRRELTEPLKVLITNDRVEVQSKGVDQRTVDNRANFLTFTNHKDALIVTIDNRRYAIFFTPQQSAEDVRRDMGGDYFVDLYNWARADGYARIAQWLIDYRIRDEFNPATRCHRAPMTSSTDEALSVSMGSVEHSIIDAVEEGRVGFRNGWIGSKPLNDLLKEIGADRKIPINKRKDLLGSLGYVWHPGLPLGRTNAVIPAEGVKSKLFIKQGHLLQNMQTASEIQARYQSDQGYPGGFGNDYSRSGKETGRE